MNVNWRQRTYCGHLRRTDAGRSAVLMGWVDAVRDHGNLLFIHLRDVSGIIQVVFDPSVSLQCYQKALLLKQEYVLEVKGHVAVRAEGTRNPNLETGEVELYATHLEVFSKSSVLPFPISEKAMIAGEEVSNSPVTVDGELRLRYRYLDLRRPSVQANLLRRSQVIQTIREYLGTRNFTEVETPFLTRSTPEGARDYLVPSRVHKGKYYALPQSPQLFKQLLMIGGMDRYFQIARCFRDEDLRPNRQPEFTQLDLEASFIDEEFIYEVVEEITVKAFRIGGIKLSSPFPRLTYKEAVARYGTDRPDLRFGMAFENVTDVLGDTKYAVFRRVIEQGGVIKGFCVKNQTSQLSKNVLQNEYALKIVPAFGAQGMSWMKFVGGRFQSNIVQYFSPKERRDLLKRFRAQEGDVIMMVGDASSELVDRVLCDLRLHVADRLGLVPPDVYRPVWITDFPLFELKDGVVTSQHHPFTMPDRTDFDPQNLEEVMGLLSRAYDLVINGEELGGGSIRIHRMDLQKKVFRALGLSSRETEAKFGFFLKALEYGVPPHGGLALGLDRVVAMILKTDSIRDVIAFPKNRRAFCPLTQAPATVDKAQLEELDLTREVEASAVSVHAATPGDTSGKTGDESRKISKGDVAHVARLARLRFTASEVESYLIQDLNSILQYVETLNELNTEGVAPTSHVLEIKNAWRKDRPRKTFPVKKILDQAPEKERDHFKVPKILEE